MVGIEKNQKIKNILRKITRFVRLQSKRMKQVIFF